MRDAVRFAQIGRAKCAHVAIKTQTRVALENVAVT